MPVLFNCDSADEVPMEQGVSRQPLITPERVGNDCILLDRWRLDPGTTWRIRVTQTDLAWFQLLDGAARLEGSEGRHELTSSNVVFLPPGFAGDMTTTDGTIVLYGQVPNAARFDPGFGAS